MATDQPALPGEETWRAFAERAIGRGVETLEGRTADGLAIAPLYARCAEDPPQPWRASRAWSIAQRIDHPEPETANQLALHDLEGGSDALVLVGAQSLYARGFGVDLDQDAISLLFDKVELDRIDLRLDAGPRTTDVLESLARLVAERHLASAALPIDIGFDPIGWHARFGTSVDDDARRLLDRRGKAGIAGSLFLADGRPWHEAGAGEAQELAAVLATAVAYLRRGEALGLALGDTRAAIALLLTAEADVLLGLAKFRAMRRLWACVEAACGLAPAPVRLHAETSWRMMTRYDPWTNAMRAAAAAFAAGLGGADCITVLPFTAVLGLPDAAARRLARNTQRVLLDEAHLAMVADPTAGAGSFEALTEALCGEAWHLFQEIERAGGIERDSARAMLKARIAETAAARAGRIAGLAPGIVGTSRYASLGVPDVEVLDVTPRPPLGAEADAGALPALRDAVPFETLRERAERTEPRPCVFLATRGTPAAFGPKVAEAANFFAAAGIAVESPPGERDIKAQIADFAASGLPVMCLCLPLTAAAETASLAGRFRAAGARYVMAAGPPDASSPITGVDGWIFDGCNALHTLAEIIDHCLARRLAS